MKTKRITQEHWPYLRTLLPPDLDESSKETGALVRRRRVIGAESLLRMALAYAVSDLSLKDVAAWAHSAGVAEITGPGLFYRLREAEKWLERLLAQTLEQDVDSPIQGYSLKAVDATVITGPGSSGTDWRAHVTIEPESGSFKTVELTDNKGGESYKRFHFQPGDIVLGDRAYALVRGIYSVKQAGADVVARLNPHSLRICNFKKEIIDFRRKSAEVPQVGVKEYKMLIPIPPGEKTKSHKTWKLTKAIDWVPVRIIGARTQKGDVIWVITTLNKKRFTGVFVMRLYRLRWQIELVFKRLKSLLHFDELPTRNGPTAKSWMLSRLLAAALAQKLLEPSGALSPWGYELR